jgi:hypothetical protein
MAQKRIDYYGRFTPTGVDTSQAKRLQALSGLAEQVGDIAFEVGTKIQTKRGAEAGLAAGAKAIETGEAPEAKEGFLSQISVFDQAYNDAMRESYIAGVNNDARENIARIAAENYRDIEGFEKSVTKYRQGLINSVGEDFSDSVSVSMDSLISSARIGVQNEVATFNLQKAKDELTQGAANALDNAIKLGMLGDQVGSDAQLQSAYTSIDGLVKGRFLTETEGQQAKREAVAGALTARARYGLQETIKRVEKAAEKAAEDGDYSVDGTEIISYIDSLTNTPVSDMTAEDQQAMSKVLLSDWDEWWTTKTRFEADEAKATTKMQNNNFRSLSIGIVSGTTGQTEITRAASAKQITGSQLNSLASILSNRGSGFDDPSTIYTIERRMIDDPEAASELIAETLASDEPKLTDKTAMDLYRKIDANPLLTTPDAKKYRRVLQRTVAIVDDSGFFTGTAAQRERAVVLELAFDDAIIAGMNPKVAAFTLIDIGNISADYENPEQIQSALNSLKEKADSGTYVSETPDYQQVTQAEYDLEVKNLQEQLAVFQSYERLENVIRSEVPKGMTMEEYLEEEAKKLGN